MGTSIITDTLAALGVAFICLVVYAQCIPEEKYLAWSIDRVENAQSDPELMQKAHQWIIDNPEDF